MDDIYLVCCICDDYCEDNFGNNPKPITNNGRSCNDCNRMYVFPERLRIIYTGEDNPNWQPKVFDPKDGVKVTLH